MCLFTIPQCHNKVESLHVPEMEHILDFLPLKCNEFILRSKLKTERKTLIQETPALQGSNS